MIGPSKSQRRSGLGLVLIGYRGTGKSTVGRILAERSGRRLVDCDREIEARSGRSIRSIFAESGEPSFRDWEERTLAELTAEAPGAILATGGGAVLRESNRWRLRDFGFVAWLTADPGELARRLEADGAGLAERPALTAAGTIDEIARVLAARTPLYQELADLVIPTDGRDPRDVAEAVLGCWRLAERAADERR
jgi:shikimate kinase